MWTYDNKSLQGAEWRERGIYSPRFRPQQLHLFFTTQYGYKNFQIRTHSLPRQKFNCLGFNCLANSSEKHLLSAVVASVYCLPPFTILHPTPRTEVLSLPTNTLAPIYFLVWINNTASVFLAICTERSCQVDISCGSIPWPLLAPQ